MDIKKQPSLGGVRGDKIVMPGKSNGFSGGWKMSEHEKWTRIPHYDDPDFTKPLLSIPAEAEEIMLSRLSFLYGSGRHSLE